MKTSFKISTKMALLLGVMVIAFSGFSYVIYSTRQTLISTIDVEALKNSNRLVVIARGAHVDFQRQVQEWKNILIRGNKQEDFDKYLLAFNEKAKKVNEGLTNTKTGMTQIGMASGEVDTLIAEHQTMLKTYLTALANFDVNDPETGKKVDTLVRGVDRATSAQLDTVIDNIAKFSSARLEKTGLDVLGAAKQSLTDAIPALVFALVAIIFTVFVVLGITRNLNRLNTFIVRFSGGDYAARSKVASGDELQALGDALNNLLDGRQSALAVSQKENDQLNTSVVRIMSAVAELAGRNLNVKVPVSEDVTGAVSDAINMMTRSTAGALSRVRQISNNVSSASQNVRQRSDQVHSVATAASNQASAASAELQVTAKALREMGEQAREANQFAERAIKTTGDALDIVRATVSGISESRDQIRETEKRVKRLGERSQEITAVVNIIGQIAERTSVLALNASMQAVAAGDAGRGFAVVADEVKRLAENARQATQQISSLVHAIQADTTETIQAMNGTIAQVVDISKLADQAGGQMNDTRAATELLATAVRSISITTQTQSRASETLLTRATELLQSSQQTLTQLDAQRKDTETLATSAQELVTTVNEFRLPA